MGSPNIYTAAVMNIFLLAPELFLHLTDFRYESGIRFGYPRPEHFISFKPDADLFWTFNPDDPGVNSQGFRENEFRPKGRDEYRIVFLGDSCTDQGYPRILKGFLNMDFAHTGRRFETVSLAVPGYSSHQGLIAARKYAKRIEPDAVVVYFGWNDHWLAYGEIDSKKTINVDERNRATSSWSRKIKLCQLIAKLASGDMKPLKQTRVLPGEYRKNLTEMASTFKSMGVLTVFITAPTLFYHFEPPDYLLASSYVETKEQAVRWHREYNDIVREVVRKQGAFLLDLEKDFNEIEDKIPYFASDGIHFSRSGLAVVAKRLSDFFTVNMLEKSANPPLTKPENNKK